MTSPAQPDDSVGANPPVPNPSVLASQVDVAEVAERSIADALAGLDGLDEVPVADHVSRFEAVHTALTDALNRAEGLLSGTGGPAGTNRS